MTRPSSSSSRAERVLVVDDNPSLRQIAATCLEAEGYDVLSAESGEKALELLAKHRVDGMVLDIRMGGIDGIETLRLVRKSQPDLAVLMWSAVDEVSRVVEAMKLEPFDYMTKDTTPRALVAKVQQMLENRRVRHENAVLRQRAEESRPTSRMVMGRSPKMREIAALVDKVAPTTATVLILGESGTGKELLARHIHQRSKRSSGPYVVVNMALNAGQGMVESDLFGHERGAFTGADKVRFGKFEQAHRGTIFLDEIGELNEEVQAKLLRVLQEREVERLGGTAPINVDVRIIAATRRNLSQMVADGKFREDLFWRLNVVPITLPPLRERTEDLPELIRHLFETLCARHDRRLTITDEAVRLLSGLTYQRNNIRELEIILERSVVTADAAVDVGDLPLDEQLQAELTQPAAAEGTLQSALLAFERAFLRRTLTAVKWNRRKAAEQLGIGYSTLKGKLKGLGITGPMGDEDEGLAGP